MRPTTIGELEAALKDFGADLSICKPAGSSAWVVRVACPVVAPVSVASPRLDDAIELALHGLDERLQHYAATRPKERVS